MKALIVDDDADAIAVLGAHLEALGLDVHASEKPREAVEFYERLLPEVVFMDIELSFPGGFIATQNIRKAAKKLGHRVVIIMHTSNQDPKSVEKAKSFGASDYMTKPVTRDGVRRKLGRFFPGFA